MSEKAVRERQKKVNSLKVRQEKVLKLREFLISEKEIVIGLLEKSLGGQNGDRIDNLRRRIHEKERQLHLVEEELKEIQARLAEAESHLKDTWAGGSRGEK